MENTRNEVVQLNKRTPITLAEFNQMASSGLLGTIIQMDESDGSNPMTEAFTLDSLMERNNYIPASGPSDEDELIEEDSAVEADSGS